MKTQGTIDLFMYWNRIRGDRQAPPRKEVEPSDIRSILPYAFILQNDDIDEISFRLAGTKLNAMFGRELRGDWFRSIFQPSDAKLIARLIESCRRDELVVSLSLMGKTQRDPKLVFDMVLLPLSKESGYGLVLGCMQSTVSNHWIRPDTLQTLRVTSLRIVDPNREQKLLSDRIEIDVPNIAPEPSDTTPFGHAVGKNIELRKKGLHLTVIEGGKRD